MKGSLYFQGYFCKGYGHKITESFHCGECKAPYTSYIELPSGLFIKDLCKYYKETYFEKTKWDGCVLQHDHYCKACMHPIDETINCKDCSWYDPKPGSKVISVTPEGIEFKMEVDTVPTRRFSYNEVFAGTLNMVDMSDSAMTKKVKELIFGIQKVIYNFPATIIIWKDGSKTVVKCGDDEVWDPEKGIAMCLLKKILGNEGNYNKIIRDVMNKAEVKGEP